ncbi:MAG TPA: YciI family protein [Solirubrobacteraceae bacterium]|nr:YciI family protein [Solirubrobacteraceae bacterium]
MQYLMLVCSNGVSTPEMAAVMQQHTPAWVEEMDASGARLLGNGLLGPDSAKTVRVRDGETLISDGPFADTKEFIAGFDIIDAENLDEAIAIAAKHPVSWYSAIELRPFMPGLEVPKQWAYADLRYLLMMFDGGGGDAPEVEAEVLATRDDWRATAAAKLVVAHGLEHRDNATTVRVRDGQLLLTDGPFAETKEFLAGIAVLNTDSEQEAIELAAEFPLARFHMVEVRPFWGG